MYTFHVLIRAAVERLGQYHWRLLSETWKSHDAGGAAATHTKVHSAIWHQEPGDTWPGLRGRGPLYSDDPRQFPRRPFSSCSIAGASDGRTRSGSGTSSDPDSSGPGRFGGRRPLSRRSAVTIRCGMPSGRQTSPPPLPHMDSVTLQYPGRSAQKRYSGIHRGAFRGMPLAPRQFSLEREGTAALSLAYALISPCCWSRGSGKRGGRALVCTVGQTKRGSREGSSSEP